MKRDPHAKPIPLTGEWSYKVTGRKLPLTGSFWFVASRLSMFRKANRLPRQGYEQCQIDVLVQRRTEKGLPSDMALLAPINPNLSPVQQFIRKRTGGCRGCGKGR